MLDKPPMVVFLKAKLNGISFSPKNFRLLIYPALVGEGILCKVSQENKMLIISNNKLVFKLYVRIKNFELQSCRKIPKNAINYPFFDCH